MDEYKYYLSNKLIKSNLSHSFVISNVRSIHDFFIGNAVNMNGLRFLKLAYGVNFFDSTLISFLIIQPMQSMYWMQAGGPNIPYPFILCTVFDTGSQRKYRTRRDKNNEKRTQYVCMQMTPLFS